MFKNYIIIAYRNLVNQKFYSVINIVGLSIGISACILFGLFIKHEFSFDKQNKNAENVYRIHFSHPQSNGRIFEAQSPALLGPTLKRAYPEVKKYSRIYFSKQNLIKAGEIKSYENGLAFADSTFFELFSFATVLGNPKELLKNTNSIVLTEISAKKYFGNINPIGKEVEINNKYMFLVTGVIKDIPENSHFKFDFIATYSSLENQSESIYLPQWGATFGSYTYILTGKRFNHKIFEKKTADFFSSYAGVSKDRNWQIHMMPMLDIHLRSHLADEIEVNSSISKIMIMGSIAIIILLLACINFINLSTARSFKRNREIGVRKVLGAQKGQLVKQFLSESVLLCVISLFISSIVILLVFPVFLNLVGAEIKFDLESNWLTLIIIISCTVIIGILAGIYPALIVSTRQPLMILKNNSIFSRHKKGVIWLRKGLVVFQFAVSIALIAGTIIINLQHNYLKKFDLGFNKEFMVVLPTHENVSNKHETIKNELISLSGVVSSTVCEASPLSMKETNTECKPNGAAGAEAFGIKVNSIGADFLDHFDIQLIAGRNFSEEFNNEQAMIINEKMVQSLGFDNPEDVIGKSYFISINGYKPEIIGVVKNYNTNSLHTEISPQVFLHVPRWFSEFVVKINSININNTIMALEKMWQKYFPNYPFEYCFLDEAIDQTYKSEQKYSQVISISSVVALFIACLGLLGLTSFVIEQKKKEIGVRIVLGASVKSILKIFSSDILTLVFVANIIAWPAMYYFMNSWLEEYAYRITISFWMFLLAGGITLLIALCTVGFQTFKAARVNPVDSLRSE